MKLSVRIWDSSGPVHVARLADISLTGAFLRLSMPLPPMTAVVVDLKWPTALSLGSVRLSGFVARQTSEGVGIEWDDFAPAGVVTIMREFLGAEPAARDFSMSAIAEQRSALLR